LVSSTRVELVLAVGGGHELNGAGNELSVRPQGGSVLCPAASLVNTVPQGDPLQPHLGVVVRVAHRESAVVLIGREVRDLGGQGKRGQWVRADHGYVIEEHALSHSTVDNSDAIRCKGIVSISVGRCNGPRYELESHHGGVGGDSDRFLDPAFGGGLRIGVGPQNMLGEVARCLCTCIINSVQEVITNRCAATGLDGIRGASVRVEPEGHGEGAVVPHVRIQRFTHDGVLFGVVPHNPVALIGTGVRGDVGVKALGTAPGVMGVVADLGAVNGMGASMDLMHRTAPVIAVGR